MHHPKTKSVRKAVMRAIENGGVDNEWKDNLTKELEYAHIVNECFSACSGHVARTDYYTMWAPEYRKARKGK